MDRIECTRTIKKAMLEKGITFQQVSELINRNIVWTTSALLGQNTFDQGEAGKVASILGLSKEIETELQIFPSKGSTITIPPTDPVLYRLHEIVLVYGETIKAIIHEKLGDGIMSAIDFTMNIEKLEDPKGDRVKITMDGKFLPYKKW